MANEIERCGWTTENGGIVCGYGVDSLRHACPGRHGCGCRGLMNKLECHAFLRKIERCGWRNKLGKVCAMERGSRAHECLAGFRCGPGGGSLESCHPFREQYAPAAPPARKLDGDGCEIPPEHVTRTPDAELAASARPRNFPESMPVGHPSRLSRVEIYGPLYGSDPLPPSDATSASWFQKCMEARKGADEEKKRADTNAALLEVINGRLEEANKTIGYLRDLLKEEKDFAQNCFVSLTNSVKRNIRKKWRIEALEAALLDMICRCQDGAHVDDQINAYQEDAHRRNIRENEMCDQIRELRRRLIAIK